MVLPCFFVVVNPAVPGLAVGLDGKAQLPLVDELPELITYGSS